MTTVQVDSVNSGSLLFCESESHSSSYADVLPTRSRYPDLGGNGAASCCCHRCRRALKAYKTLRRANYVLSFLCVVAIAVYVATMVHLWGRFPSGGSSDPVGAAALRNDHPYCVQRKKIDMFGGLQTDSMSTDYSVTGDKYCFKTLDWVPAILSQVYDDLDKRVKTTEERVQDLIPFGARGSEATATAPSGVQGQGLLAGYRPRPFAHVMLNTSHHYTADETAIKWSASGMTGSHLRDMNLNSAQTDLVIKHSGYYFIYSHLEYTPYEQQKEGEQPRLQVFLNHRDNSLENGRRKLMESPGPAPFVQGVFLLREKDTISVHTTTSKVFADRGRSNYLGIFLI